MGRLRSALQAQLYDSGDPVAALERLDDLVAALRVVSFATALAVVLEPGTGTVTMCSAGHPPPVLRGSATTLVDVTPRPPVGARIGGRTATRMTVNAAETLLLYTDGLVEARTVLLDERLATLCRVVAAGRAEPGALLDHVLDAMLGRSAPDDVAALAARRD